MRLRKKSILIGLTIVFLITSCAEQLSVSTLLSSTDIKQSQVALSRGLLVKLKPVLAQHDTAGNLNRQQVLRDAGLVEVVSWPDFLPNWILVDPQAGIDTAAAISALQQHRDIEKVEENTAIQRQVFSPDNPALKQHALVNTFNQNKRPVDSASSELPTPSDTVIAILDAGVDLERLVWKNAVWVNKQEIPDNGIDDDNNGKIDDYTGWNFVNNHKNINDIYYQGAYIVNLIAQQVQQHFIINGAANGTGDVIKILPLKVLDDQGQGFMSTMISALEYAMQQGAKVSNISWGSPRFSQALYDAIKATQENNHLVIAAAGDHASNNDQIPFFPASFDLPNIVAVAASDLNHQLAQISNFGVNSVDVMAPSVAIYAAQGQQAVLSGTVTATPVVSAAVAMMLSYDDTLSYFAAKDVLLQQVIAVPEQLSPLSSGGLVDIPTVLTSVLANVSTGVTADQWSHANRLKITLPQLAFPLGLTHTLSATAGTPPYTWSIDTSSLITIETLTGKVIPQALGRAWVTVTDSESNVSEPMLLVVTPMSIQPAAVTQLALNVPTTFVAHGGYGPYQWEVLGDPQTVDIVSSDSQDNVITVVPKTLGQFRLRLTDTDAFSFNLIDTENMNVLLEILSIESPLSHHLIIDQTLVLQASGGRPSYQWQSSHPDIATVDPDTGLVTGMRTGGVTISVIDANEIIDTIDLFVNTESLRIKVMPPDIAQSESEIPGTALWGNDDFVWLRVEGGVPPYRWSSSHPGIAWVNDEGKVVPGGVFIESNLLTKSVNINVADSQGNRDQMPLIVNKRFISVSKTALMLGETMTIVAQGAGQLRWQVMGTGDAIIDSERHVLTATKTGFINLTMTDALGYTVLSELIAINLSPLAIQAPDTTELWVGADAVQFSALTGQPPYTWSTDTPKRMTVNPVSGEVVAVLPGVATLRVSDQAGNSNTMNLLIRRASLRIPIAAMEVGESVPLLGEGFGDLLWQVVEGLAIINQAGVLTVEGPGEVQVRVIDSLNISATAVVEVKPVQALRIDSPITTQLWVGNANRMALHARGGTPPYTWSSTNADILSVEEGRVGETGEVVAGDFPAIIDAYLREASIIVTDAKGDTVSLPFTVGKVVLASPVATISVGDSLQLSAMGKGTLVWDVSGETQAVMTNAGLLQADLPGEMQVRVTDENNNRAEMVIWVIPHAPLSIIATTDPTLWVNQKVAPANRMLLTAQGGRAPYTWRSSDTSIAVVTNNGEVIAGDFTADPRNNYRSIIVTVTDERGHTADIPVTVRKVAIASDKTTFYVGESVKLQAAGLGVLSFAVTGEGVATLDALQRLMAVSAGDIRVTVTDANNNIAVLELTINAVSELNIDPPLTTLLWVGNASNVKLIPRGGIPPYTWFSNNSSLASVTTEGVVQAGDFIASMGTHTRSVTIVVNDAQGNIYGTKMTVGKVVIASPKTKLLQGDSVQLVVDGVAPFTWSLTGEGRVTLTESGLLTALTPGAVTVLVTDQNNNSASLNLSINALLTVQINTTQPTTLWVGNVGTLVLTAEGGKGPYHWASSNTSIASVDANGVVTSGDFPATVSYFSRSVVISASDVYGSTQDITLVVNKVAIATPFTVIDEGDNLSLSGVGEGVLVWSVTGSGQASISDSGLLSAIAAGGITVTVTDQNNNSASIDLTINALGSLLIEPPVSTTLWVGNANVVALNAVGGKAPYTWLSSNASIAKIDANGVVTAGDFVAMTDSATRTVMITVTDAKGYVNYLAIEVRKLILGATNATLYVGDAQQLVVMGEGNLNWVVTGTGVATVDATGLLTADAAGDIVVTVIDINNNTARVNLVIVELLPLAIEVPLATTLWVGKGNNAVTLNAIGGKTPYHWASNTQALATVDSTGRVSTGDFIATPTNNSRNVTLQLTDANAQTRSLVLTLRKLALASPSPGISAGESIQLAAAGFGQLNWSVSDTSIAIINNNGLLTGYAEGDVIVTVTDENSSRAEILMAVL